MKRDEAAHETSGNLKNDVSGTNSCSTDWEGASADILFPGMAENKTDQNAGVEKGISHWNRGERPEP